jgi:hypothetical protein
MRFVKVGYKFTKEPIIKHRFTSRINQRLYSIGIGIYENSSHIVLFTETLAFTAIVIADEFFSIRQDGKANSLLQSVVIMGIDGIIIRWAKLFQ